MKRSIPIAGVALAGLCAVTAILAMPPAAAEAGVAPLRTQAPAEVQAMLNAACATCHDLSAVQPGLYTMAEWQETIDRMFGYGATLTPEQTSQILAYLGTDAPAADSPAAGGDGDAGDDAATQALLESKCATCHDLSAVQPGLYTAAEWTETLNRMLGYGASLSDEEFQTIVNFLATDSEAESGTGEVDVAAAQSLLNTACATCHDLSAVEPGVYTAAEWTDTINRMLGYGASVSEADMNLLLDYLASDR